MPIPMLSEARAMLLADDDLLRSSIVSLSEVDLIDPGPPMGDSCESLRDLVAHHTMWREIAYSILGEALAGRHHWSTLDAWSTREAGQRLNHGGVLAGRVLLVPEVLDRFESAAHALAAALDRLDERDWDKHVFTSADHTLGQWLAIHLSVPGHPPFQHVSLHLSDFGRSAVA